MEFLVVCGGIVEKDGKILLVQEAKESARGLWNVPAGHFDPPERIIDGAFREIKEETGFDVKIDGLLGVYQYAVKNGERMTIRFQFKASIISGKLKIPKGEILDAKWFAPKEILAMDDSKLRSSSVKATVRDYLSGKLYPVDAIKYLR
ncbi:ADP-ribose pyrophosphatase [uncultured archaeon]|nr:ADP-ribose pyrophosphatase [uncultured archaeon]